MLMNVINSNDLSTLALICSQVIQKLTPPNNGNPFAFEKVIVMNKGMQTYLQQEIAKQNGVCSGIDFEQVWAFIWSLHKNLNNADSSNRFSHEHMTWSIFSLMDEISKSDDPIYEPMKEYLNLDTSIEKTEKAYQLCGAIADTFDQYQMYRPDWILAWNKFDDSVFDAVSVEDGKYKVAPGSVLADWIAKATSSKYKESGAKSTSRKDNAVRSIVGNIWQIKLWTKLKGNLEKTNNEANLWDRATVVSNLIQKLEAMQSDPATIDYSKMPKRVFIFGVTALPTQVIQLFSALGKIIPVFFMNLNPCQEYWGDMRSEKVNWKWEKEQIVKYLRSNALKDKYELDIKGVHGFDLSSAKEDAYYENFYKNYENDELVDGNPLLISLGKQGRDTLNTLLSQEDAVDVTQAFVDRQKGEDDKINDDLSYLSVLDTLKQRLLTLDSKGVQLIKDNDRSFQIRSCHTPMREIEILRDEILSTIKKEKDDSGKATAPRDMLVMMPDIESYAPLIEAVFGSVNRDDPDFISYSICDKTVRSSSKIADAVVQLLSIGNKGITANLISDLLSVDAIANKFGITVDDLSVIENWLAGAKVHWGLDEQEVKENLNFADENKEPLPWTLEAGLNRLLKGFMLGSGSDTDGYDDIDTGDFELLNKFCEFVDKIKQIRDEFSPNLNITTLEWTQKLQVLLLDNFFVLDDDSKEEVEAISQLLSEMNEAVNNLKGSESSQENSENDSLFDEGVRSNIKIKLPVFRAKLIHAFGNDRDSSRYLRGGLIFCSLMPMRAVPFKHIYILGLNDDAFPRKDTTPSFNLMGVKSLSRINDRSLSIDDRYIFLEAILSAEKSLYLSYLGESPIDKTQKNPSTVITELEDYLGDNFTVPNSDPNNSEENRKNVLKRLFRQERLNSYDLINYQKESSDSLKLYPSFNKTAFWKMDISENGLPTEKDKKIPIGCLGNSQDKNPWNITLQPNITVSISDLKNALLNPCKSFLKSRLNIKLDLKNQIKLNDEEPFSLDNLDKSDILREIIESEMISSDKSIDEILEKHTQKGELPYDIFNDKTVNEIKDSLNKFSDSLIGMPQTDIYSEQQFSKTLKVNGYTVTFAGELPKRSDILMDFMSNPDSENAGMMVEAFLRLLAYKYIQSSSIPQQAQKIRVVNKKFESYDVDGSKFNDHLKDCGITPDDILKRFIEFYLTANLIPIPLCKSVFKDFASEKSKRTNTNKRNDTTPDWDEPTLDDYLVTAVTDKTFNDYFNDSYDSYAEAKYLFGCDKSFLEPQYLSASQIEEANQMLELFSTMIFKVTSKRNNPKN